MRKNLLRISSYQYNKRLKNKKYKSKITVMCDYCAFPIWYNGINVSYNSKLIPFSLKIFQRRFDNWANKYESMFTIETLSDFEQKVFNNTNFYQNWIREGFELTKIVRKLTTGRYDVEYFNENKVERIIFNKRKKYKYNKISL
jgi:hypothetical protein